MHIPQEVKILITVEIVFIISFIVVIFAEFFFRKRSIIETFSLSGKGRFSTEPMFFTIIIAVFTYIGIVAFTAIYVGTHIYSLIP